MANSDARFGYRASLPRQDHDLSQPLGFTSAAGMLLPIWFDLATPGDKYYMTHKMPLLRSSQLAAPAMVDVKVHFETFFVPMQMIYEPFENTVYSLRNLRSSFYDTQELRKEKFPLFSYSSYIANVLNSYGSTDFHADAFRLADLFGLYPDNFSLYRFDEFENYTNAAPFFPYQILAYHTIFEYYYRLDDKSYFHNDWANWDKYYNSSQVVTDVDFMQIHQRPWDFDYFTSMYRSPIVSDQNTQKLLDTGQYSSLTDSLTLSVQPAGFGGTNTQIAGFSNATGDNYYYGQVQQAISTAAIRQMFANEKLAMITGRAKKTYDAQVLAHLGVPVPHDVKHDVTLIHHDVYDLNVQEVTSLASTEQSPLGELAGKSYAAGNGKQFKFEAPCHGVIMTIFSIEPKKKYFNTFDKINMITNAYDIPTPEWDRLGNQPMFRGEVGWNPVNLDPEHPDERQATDIIGWKERYYANKRKPAKVTYAFGFYNNFTTNNYSAYMLGFRPFSTVADANNVFPEPRPDLENRFYIERNAMDNLCMVKFAYGWIATDSENWNNTPWLAYARDPFIVDSHILCKKVSWMSKDGEPIYD